MGWGSQQQVAIMRQLKWRRCPPPVKQVKLEAEIKVENVGGKKKKKTKAEREREEGEVGLEGGASHLEGRCNDVTREKSLTTV